MTKGQIAGTVIGVLAAVALGICLCTYFQRLKEKNDSQEDEEVYGGEDGDGQPDEDDEYADQHPEAKKSAVANPLHKGGHQAVSSHDVEEGEDDDEYEEVEVEVSDDEDAVVPKPAPSSSVHAKAAPATSDADEIEL